jgi:hypothetical protein
VEIGAGRKEDEDPNGMHNVDGDICKRLHMFFARHNKRFYANMKAAFVERN